MLSPTEKGEERAHTLEESTVKGLEDSEMAFLAAVDIASERPVGAYELANQLPFVHNFFTRRRLVETWVEEGYFEDA